MNANAIFKGNEYAYVDYPSRNVSYYPMARRVRVLHVYKVEDQWRQRKQTLVEVQVLDSETGESLNGNGIKTLKARQIVAQWSEHLVEKERHDAIRRERDAEARRRSEELERQREESARIYREKTERIYAALETIGIPRSMVTVNSYEVRIARHRLDEYLEGGEHNDNGEGVARSESNQESTTP